ALVFPQISGSPFRSDVSFLRAAPNLTEALVEGLRRYGARSTIKSYQGRRSELQTGFVQFLVETKIAHLRLRELDRAFWVAFIGWLDAKVNSRTGKVIAPKTRTLTFGATVAVLRELVSAAAFAADARRA